MPIDLAKGEHRQPAFLAKNPFGRVPVLVDGDLTLPESTAILASVGRRNTRLWPTSGAGRAEALHWLFFLSQHIMPPAGEVALRFRAKVFGRPLDAAGEATIKRGEEALPAPLAILEGHTGGQQMDLRADSASSIAPIAQVLNVVEVGFRLVPDIQSLQSISTRVAPVRPGPDPRLPGL